MHITAHAISRYRERVAAVSEAEAREALSSETIRKAIEFGAHYVRLGTGQRIVIDGCRIITILPAEQRASSLSLDRDARHMR